MVIDKLISLGQLLLAVAIVLFVLYRVALLFNLVPEDFSPSGFVHHEYKSFKMSLAESTGAPGISGKIAKIVLKNINRIEDHYAAKNNMTEQERRIAEECEENSLYRFFMFSGGDKAENSICIENQKKIEEENMNNRIPAQVQPSQIQPSQFQPEQTTQ